MKSKFQRSPAFRIASLALCSVAGVLSATGSQAAEKGKKSSSNSSQCGAAWKGAQARSDAGHLRQARDLLLACARPACGAAYMRQCGAKFTQVDSDIPTVVPLLTDEAGAPVTDVQVKADGEIVTLRLDGRALPIDPGMHEFSFSAANGSVLATEKVMIIEGQRNRPITVSLHSPSPHGSAPASVAWAVRAAPADKAPDPPAGDASPPRGAVDPPSASASEASAPIAPTAETPPPAKEAGRKKPLITPLPLALAGAGLASVGVGALLTFWGRQDNAALSACAPNCAGADVDHIRTLYLASDIAFGVGAAALGAGALFFFLDRTRHERPARTGCTFELQPTASGAFGAIKGTF